MTYRQKVRKIFPDAKYKMVYDGMCKFHFEIIANKQTIFKTYYTFFNRAELVWKQCYLCLKDNENE